MNEIDYIRRAGLVERYHVMPTLRRQNIAEHSWGVAMLIFAVSEEEPSADLIKAALTHDLPEIETGDLPAPLKWADKVISDRLKEIEANWYEFHCPMPSLTMKEQALLKFADSMDLVLFCLQEARMGNKEMAIVADRGLMFIQENGLQLISVAASDIFISTLKEAGEYQ